MPVEHWGDTPTNEILIALDDLARNLTKNDTVQHTRFIIMVITPEEEEGVAHFEAATNMSHEAYRSVLMAINEKLKKQDN